MIGFQFYAAGTFQFLIVLVQGSYSALQKVRTGRNILRVV